MACFSVGGAWQTLVAQPKTSLLCRGNKRTTYSRHFRRSIIYNSLPSRGTTSREPAARSESTALGETPLLNDRVEQLIKEQIAKPIFDSTLLPEPFNKTCKIAQNEGRFLNENELNQFTNEEQRNNGVNASRKLGENVRHLVDGARKCVCETYPGIIDKDGALYPSFRAEACWRDFWHFVRVVSYGVVANVERFTNDDGMKIMNEIYQELEVPLDAMVTGVKELGTLADQLMESDGEKVIVEKAFGHLVNRLESFSTK